MPYKDEQLYWKVRLPRTLRNKVEKTAKKLGFTNIKLLELAVDNWLNDNK